MTEIRSGDDKPEVLRAAARYAIAAGGNTRELAVRLLDDRNPVVAETVLETLPPGTAAELLTHHWLETAAADSSPARRRVAAVAVGAAGDEGTGVLHLLLADPDPGVVAAAVQAAGRLAHRTYVESLVSLLANPRLRGDAVRALAAYGPGIAGTLGDILADEATPLAVRRQVPRVLGSIPHQKSVDVLIPALNHPNLLVRSAALRALSRLRAKAPGLKYDGESLPSRIREEARRYYELTASLEPLREHLAERSPAGLLAKTLEERLKESVERMFRLLGLRYPPKEIYAVYRAVQKQRSEELANAVEFLDNVVERDLKRILLPLFDASVHGRPGLDLFGIREKSPVAAIRELIRSGDAWLVSCAMAAAAQLGLSEVAGEIREAASGADAEISLVAETALASLGETQCPN